MHPTSENRTHAVAMIGFGIQARTGLAPSFCKQHDLGVRVAAVCDCDRTRREAGAAQIDKAYADAGVAFPP